ncbi:MAG: Protein of unknown function precursor [Bacteroidetes bacterium]|jgi:hypothetical protein|nr:Protein of unknown function precursor [Bacteroidota bacterium]
MLKFNLPFSLFLMLTFSCSTSVFSQEKTVNLPPGAVINIKSYVSIDYSYKLVEIPSSEPLNYIQGDFLKEISKDLADMKVNAPESYKYYTIAQAYYNGLSNKVKTTFTIDELWYIYYYDQKLKNQLQDIR